MISIEEGAGDDFGLRMYLDQIRHIPALTAAAERAVVRRIAAGDEVAKKELAAANLGVVVRIAEKYRRRGVSQLNLIQEGNAALMKAVRRYSPANKQRFGTYASGWITRAVRAAAESE